MFYKLLWHLLDKLLCTLLLINPAVCTITTRRRQSSTIKRVLIVYVKGLVGEVDRLSIPFPANNYPAWFFIFGRGREGNPHNRIVLFYLNIRGREGNPHSRIVLFYLNIREEGKETNISCFCQSKISKLNNFKNVFFFKH